MYALLRKNQIPVRWLRVPTKSCHRVEQQQGYPILQDEVIIEILDTWNINLLWLTILKKLNITTNCINSIILSWNVIEKISC